MGKVNKATIFKVVLISILFLFRESIVSIIKLFFLLDKTGVAVLGLIGALVASILSNSRQRKTTFINVVTSSRIIWIKELKKSMADFLCLTRLGNSGEIIETKEEQREFFKELTTIKNNIFLHLNADDDYDKAIMNIINEIYYCVESLYGIYTITQLDKLSDKVGYMLQKITFKDTVIFEQLDIAIDHLNDGNILVEGPKIIDMIKIERKTQLMNSATLINKKLEKYHNELIMRTQIYCKYEWERVKSESKGNEDIEEKPSEDEMKKKIKSYNLELFNYSRDTLADIIKEAKSLV